MTPQIYLSLAFHNHQPVGNFGWVFEEAYEKSYLPMVECLERHPTIRVALHYTGPLRDWLTDNVPDFFPRVVALVERGQIEIMSGAYYEPILVSLYDDDKQGQILKQNQSVRDDFNYDPNGLWLAERIWEPHLPRPIQQAGIEYTIVDDTHFKSAGFKDEDLFGYYVTEEQAHTLKIFATSMYLRYSIPWKPVDDVIGWLRSQSTAPDPVGRYVGKTRVAVMGDDGEKFGMWPGTYEHVWEKGWMDNFFTALEENHDWVQTIPPGEAARNLASLGRIYLPTSSYDEMGEWAMPPEGAWELPHLKHQLAAEKREDVRKYMRGGLWRNFMIKYPEVNHMHKKALWVSRKVHAMLEGTQKNAALDHLWAGQCNCGYWHGVFGGIYLFHIREADYRQLIAAENLAEGLNENSSAPFVNTQIGDFDYDDLDDVVITSDVQSLVFDVEQGGGLVEWDFRPAEYNVLNVLSRRPEGYHRDLREAAEAGLIVTPDTEHAGDAPDSIHSEVVRAREADLDKKLFYDWYRRASFLDHFLGEDAVLDKFYRSDFPEQGDFVNQPYKISIDEREALHILTLSRDGHIWQDEVQLAVNVTKQIAVAAGSNSMKVKYVVTNNATDKLETCFGIETNWGFAGGNEERHAHLVVGGSQHSLGAFSEYEDVDSYEINCNLWKTSIDFAGNKPGTMWVFPLESISASEAGFERLYQGSTFLHLWPLSLKAGESWPVVLEYKLKQL